MALLGAGGVGAIPAVGAALAIASITPLSWATILASDLLLSVPVVANSLLYICRAAPQQSSQMYLLLPAPLETFGVSSTHIRTSGSKIWGFLTDGRH